MGSYCFVFGLYNEVSKAVYGDPASWGLHMDTFITHHRYLTGWRFNPENKFICFYFKKLQNNCPCEELNFQVFVQYSFAATCRFIDIHSHDLVLVMPGCVSIYGLHTCWSCLRRFLSTRTISKEREVSTISLECIVHINWPIAGKAVKVILMELFTFLNTYFIEFLTNLRGFELSGLTSEVCTDPVNLAPPSPTMSVPELN